MQLLNLAAVFVMLFLGWLFSSIAVFICWLIADALDILEAISEIVSHLYTITMRPRPRVPKPPFRFLDLPAEIRVMIYEHHFAPYREDWCQKLVEGTLRYPDPLLAVNRQIRQEASHVLYSKMRPVMLIFGTSFFFGDSQTMYRLVQRALPILKHMTKVCLQIKWPLYCYSGLWSPNRCVRSAKLNIAAACALMTGMPDLQSVTIRFLADGRERLVVLERLMLRSLRRKMRLLEIKNPRVVIEWPQEATAESTELRETSLSSGGS